METQTLLLLAPLVIGEIVMKILALLNLAKQERTRGHKLMWVFVILLVSVFGWIAYFLLGREEQ